jgi:hypothetical protein
MSCSKNSGRIKLIRGVAPDVRYVGICDDCGISTEPTSMATAHLALNSHFKVVRLDSRRGCVCAECAPALAAARKADLDAEVEASRRRRS